MEADGTWGFSLDLSFSSSGCVSPDSIPGPPSRTTVISLPGPGQCRCLAQQPFTLTPRLKAEMVGTQPCASPLSYAWTPFSLPAPHCGDARSSRYVTARAHGCYLRAARLMGYSSVPAAPVTVFGMNSGMWPPDTDNAHSHASCSVRTAQASRAVVLSSFSTLTRPTLWLEANRKDRPPHNPLLGTPANLLGSKPKTEQV